jgi:hypothetical protein
LWAPWIRPLLTKKRSHCHRELHDSFFTAPDRCHSRDVDAVFRVESDSISDLVISEFYSPLIRQPPPREGTEDSFHHFWDDNLHRILLWLHRGVRATRNSNLHMRTGRPDFAFIVKGNVCIFRGEERPTATGKTLRQNCLRSSVGSIHPHHTSWVSTFISFLGRNPS